MDNASNDNSATFLKQNFPDITILESPENIGFGRANNLATERALSDILFFLNSDTIIINNSIKTLYDYLTQHPETGVCGGILLNADGSIGYSASHQLSLSHDFISFIPFLKKTPIESRLSSVTEVGYVIGADMMIKKEVFEKAGKFDPDFFLYCEEAELSYRIKKLNYKIQLLPSAQIIHLEGKSGQKDQIISYEKWHSRFLYFHKVYSPRHPYYLYLLYSSQCLIALTIHLFNSNKKRIWRSRYQSMKGGFKRYIDHKPFISPI